MGDGPVTVVLQIEGGDEGNGEETHLKVRRKIDGSQAFRLAAMLDEMAKGGAAGGEASDPRLELVGASGPSAGDSSGAGTARRPDVTLGEFVRGLSLRNNFQRIAAVCHWRESQMGVESTDRDAVLRAFRTAGWSMPKNIGRDLKHAQGRGLIAEDPTHADHYYVTQRGRELLAPQDESAS